MGFLFGRVTTVVALLALVWLSTVHAIQLYFNKGNFTASFTSTQRCYSIEQRWNDRSENAEWEGLPDASEFVFYENVHCKGYSISRALYPTGSCDFRDTKLYNKVSSFMVSMHVIDADDDEKAELNSTNSASYGAADADLLVFDDNGSSSLRTGEVIKLLCKCFDVGLNTQ